MGVNLSGQVPKDPGNDNILDRLGGEAGGLGKAIGDGLNNIVKGIGNALRGIFDPNGVFAPIGAAAQEIRDGQLDLQHRIDLIPKILDYGSVFIPKSGKFSGSGTLSFTEQLGPMRGVEQSGKGMKLLAAGLWDIRMSYTTSWILTNVAAEVVVTLRVKRPDGSVYSEQKSRIQDPDTTTQTLISSVVVPDPGYTVEAHVSQSATRGMLGGPAWSRLTVQRIDDRTVGNWSTGAEGSDVNTERKEK